LTLIFNVKGRRRQEVGERLSFINKPENALQTIPLVLAFTDARE